jgi:hypothetical protein
MEKEMKKLLMLFSLLAPLYMSTFSITVKNSSAQFLKAQLQTGMWSVASGIIKPSKSGKVTFTPNSSTCNNLVLNHMPENVMNQFSFARKVCGKTPTTLSGEFSKGIKGFYYGINSKISITNGGTYEYSNGKFSPVK